MFPNEICEIIAGCVLNTNNHKTILALARTSQLWFDIIEYLVRQKCCIKVKNDYSTITNYLACRASRCIHCHKKTIRENFYERKYKVCLSCESNYDIVSLSRAKRKYKLTDDDLSNIPSKMKKGKWGWMTLFLDEDVYELAMIVHGKDKLDAFDQHRIDRQNKIEQTKEMRKIREKEMYDLFKPSLNAQQYIENDESYCKYIRTGIPRVMKRKNALIEALRAKITAFEQKEKIQNEERYYREKCLTQALQEVGLSLRYDSVLCSDYIRKNKGNLNSIIEVMLEMDWYFKFTTYENDRFDHEYQCDSRRGKHIALQKWMMKNADRKFTFLDEKPPDTIRYLLMNPKTIKCIHTAALRCSNNSCKNCCLGNCTYHHPSTSTLD